MDDTEAGSPTRRPGRPRSLTSKKSKVIWARMPDEVLSKIEEIGSPDTSLSDKVRALIMRGLASLTQEQQELKADESRPGNSMLALWNE